jgi:cation:H+ antiporter
VDFLFLAGGLVLLVLGGERLVRSAASLAYRLGLSPLVIGLSVVAFGTSAPELAATLASAIGGVPDLGVGNVIGSNIANVALILAVAALIVPIPSNRAFVSRDLPAALIAMAVLVPMAADGLIGRLDGLILLALLAAYLILMFKQDDEDGVASEAEEVADPQAPLWRGVAGAVFGIGLLVLGAEGVVSGATGIAERLGVSERVIGLTLVAFGTSLPELASSIAAVRHRQGDMILGNIAGSSVFNVLAVMGASSLAVGIPVRLGAIAPDLGAAAIVTALLIPVMLIRGRLGRVPAAVLLALYLAYVTFVFLTPGEGITVP